MSDLDLPDLYFFSLAGRAIGRQHRWYRPSVWRAVRPYGRGNLGQL